MNRIRKITLTGLLLLFALLPLAAQERTDTVYTFRFVTGNDMFYVPWNGNDKELARLEACVERLKERIFAGEIPVRVEATALLWAARSTTLRWQRYVPTA